MGIGYKGLSLLRQTVKDIGLDKVSSVGSFGYIDIELTGEELKKLLGAKAGEAQIRIDSYCSEYIESRELCSVRWDNLICQVVKWAPRTAKERYIVKHGLLRKMFHLEKIVLHNDALATLGVDHVPALKRALLKEKFSVEAKDTIRLLFDGATYQSIDLNAHTGTEIIHNLNNPIPREWEEQFDVLIDAGTLEHCFNVPQVLSNAAKLLRVGGLVYHVVPLTWPNHGFYNFNPCLLHEFYSANGFRTRKVLCGFNYGEDALKEVSTVETFPLPPENTLLFYIAEKMTDATSTSITYPTQSIYS